MSPPQRRGRAGGERPARQRRALRRVSSVARGGQQRTEKKDVRGEETGRTGDGKEGDNSATVTGAGDASRLEHRREGDVGAGVDSKGAAVD